MGAAVVGAAVVVSVVPPHALGASIFKHKSISLEYNISQILVH